MAVEPRPDVGNELDADVGRRLHERHRCSARRNTLQQRSASAMSSRSLLGSGSASARFGMGHPRGVIEITRNSSESHMDRHDRASGFPQGRACGCGLTRCRDADCRSFGPATESPYPEIGAQPYTPVDGLSDPSEALFRSHRLRCVLEAEDHDECGSNDSVRGAAGGSTRAAA